MKVSLYSKLTDITPFKNLNIHKALEDIKKGKYKDQVEKARVVFYKESEYKKEKNKLPLIGWSGTFTTRGNNNLIDSSGFATLDYDKIDDLDSLIENVNNDKYTFSSFITPSGKGLKVLVKIPLVSNDKDYKSFYLELKKHYDNYSETDPSTKDISRASFVSYDPSLFINPDSEMFTDRFIEKIIPKRESAIRVDDMGEVANRLLVWFNKKWRSGSERNNHLFILSSAFNDYGVDKSVALDYCLSYVASDFKESEINNLVNSAYKKRENFGTKFFEDNQKSKVLKNMVFSGATKENIKKTFDVSDEYLENIENEIPEDVFWDVSDKGKISISFFRFDRYLKNKGISKYFQDEKSDSFDFVIKDSNFINWIDTSRIKDIVKKDLINRGAIEVWDTMASNTKYFSRDSLSMLDTIEIKYKRDTKNESFLYYKNYAIRTTKDVIEKIEYNNIDDLIWSNQVIDRDIKISKESDGVFKTFIWKVSGENKDRYYTLKSVIGYLLHSYQNDSKPKTIIFNDEMLSDDVPNGGSGKGLIHKAIARIKNVVVEDGKRFDPRGQFAYQKVNKDTQIFLMDDVSKNFNFEDLFSIVTEGMTVEKKGKDAFKIPFNESPKLSITTNYTVRGDSPSFYRRVFEVEIANYFNDKHTPEDEFKHQFFSEWSETEWQNFDNFMIRCLQYFLKNGLVESQKVNLALRKLKNNVGIEFIEFMEGQTLENLSISRKAFRDEFDKKYDKIARFNTAQKFNKKVKDYCEYYKIDLEEKKYNGVVTFNFKPTNENTEEDEFEF